MFLPCKFITYLNIYKKYFSYILYVYLYIVIIFTFLLIMTSINIDKCVCMYHPLINYYQDDNIKKWCSQIKDVPNNK